MNDIELKKAYVLAVDMGYGHQRAVFPFIDIAAVPEEWNLAKPTIICANNYPGIPFRDRLRWEGTRKLYETISRFKSIPFIGPKIFGLMDHFQRIEPFYPKRDLSKASMQVRQMYKMIKKGFGKHLIDTLNKNPLPLLTSFFGTAFFAEEHGYKGPIYCLCTDTDISRAWAPLNPQQSRIIYLAPNERVQERLKLYGIAKDKIVVTGFPLPKKVTGPRETLATLKTSVKRRILKLDNKGLYQKKYQKMLVSYLGDSYQELIPSQPLTITFAVGGAGAQVEIGLEILRSLRSQIVNKEIKLNLIAGASKKINKRYLEEVVRLDMKDCLDRTVRVLYNPDKIGYFEEFNDVLIETDILWTKPSELSFYSGLGLPIIMAPTIGSQEECNRDWLHLIGAGFEQNDPKYTNEWLFDWLKSGWLAEAALSGFLNAPKNGTYHVEDLVLHGRKTEIEDIHFI
jgi:hypothetical protein